jgi:hypothetical protein
MQPLQLQRRRLARGSGPARWLLVAIAVLALAGVQDVGVRVEHGADISVAGTSVPISGGAMNWSFVGVSAIASTGVLQ